MTSLELYLRHDAADSRRVRDFVEDHQIGEHLLVRDLADPLALNSLGARGGSAAPALWDGERLYEGAEAVLARLTAFLNIGRAD